MLQWGDMLREIFRCHFHFYPITILYNDFIKIIRFYKYIHSEKIQTGWFWTDSSTIMPKMENSSLLVKSTGKEDPLNI